jgi:hypothetical protein
MQLRAVIAIWAAVTNAGDCKDSTKLLLTTFMLQDAMPKVIHSNSNLIKRASQPVKVSDQKIHHPNPSTHPESAHATTIFVAMSLGAALLKLAPTKGMPVVADLLPRRSCRIGCCDPIV